MFETEVCGTLQYFIEKSYVEKENELAQSIKVIQRSSKEEKKRIRNYAIYGSCKEPK